MRKEWNRSLIRSTGISLIFTVVILGVFNLEIDGQSEVASAWVKNTMLAVLSFIFFFTLIHTDFIIAKFKRIVREQDEYIEHLESQLDDDKLDTNKDVENNKD